MFAYVQIRLKDCDEQHVLHEILQIEEIKEAHILFGEWDIIAKVEHESPESLGAFVIEKIRSLPEVKMTSTMIVAK